MPVASTWRVEDNRKRRVLAVHRRGSALPAMSNHQYHHLTAASEGSRAMPEGRKTFPGTWTPEAATPAAMRCRSAKGGAVPRFHATRARGKKSEIELTEIKDRIIFISPKSSQKFLVPSAEARDIARINSGEGGIKGSSSKRVPRWPNIAKNSKIFACMNKMSKYLKKDETFFPKNRN